MQPVKFPDAETEVRAYLRPFFPGLRISSRVPDPRPAAWLRIMRTGGQRETIVSDRPQITMEAWAATETEAVELLGNARAYINAADGRIFGVVEISGPANLPDPTTAQIRYTMSVWIRIRGQAITGN